MPRAAFEEVHKAALTGDASALRELETLWADYDGANCFLCDADTPRAEICSEVMAEYGDSTKLIVLPLCPSCRDLWKPVRLSRCMKLLKKMWSARSGKCVTFAMRPARR